MFIDAHAHLDHPSFHEDVEQVIERAKKAGVGIIVANGVNPETNRRVLELAKKYAIVKAALGIYPIEALQQEIKEGEYPLKPNVFDVNEEIDFIRKQKNHIVGIGECGLDDHHVQGKLESQKKVFEKMIGLAEQVKKPIIVHSRKAEQEVLDMLISSRIKKVLLHCFSGNMKQVKQGEEEGYYFSIPANVTFSTHFQEMVKRININQLLTETDCPYLSPFKGQRNEPAFVVESTKKIAELKGFTLEETENNIMMNYKTLFQ
ncbi:TatD family hydrolase [Candidatus Woesearchaeota archaeon]|nr:TatD family hydrolase [Candidatus Woesearchaeota archaeon]